MNTPSTVAGLGERVEEHDQLAGVRVVVPQAKCQAGAAKLEHGVTLRPLRARHLVLDRHPAAVDLDHRRRQRSLDHVAQAQRHPLARGAGT